jgi:hypothetical protein
LGVISRLWGQDMRQKNNLKNTYRNVDDTMNEIDKIVNKIEKWKEKIRQYYASVSREQLKKDLERVGFKVKYKKVKGE